mgnify:CR=1 FL=1
MFGGFFLDQTGYPEVVRKLLMALLAAAVFAIVTMVVVAALQKEEAPASAPTASAVAVETVAENLKVPWEIAWLPDGEALVTERTGAVRVLKDGKLRDEPALTVPVAEDGEGGLQGLAVDSQYADNQFVYVYVTESNRGRLTNRVVRYRHQDGRLVEPKVLVDGIPGNTNHNGGRLAFGPDGFLYVTTGDAESPQTAQDRNSLSGKILRITRDGQAAPDNPFGNLVWSFGHRNPQGLAWDSSGQLYETEHGPTGEFGLCCRDELNRIERGGNYGWPVITGDQVRFGMATPIANSGTSQTWAPGGIAFGPDGKLYAATLRGDHLRVFTIQNGKVTDQRELFVGEFGRLRTARFGPDGKLYLLTSNQDGRGEAKPGDDKVIRLNVLP